MQRAAINMIQFYVGTASNTKLNLVVPCYTNSVSALCMQRTCLVNAAGVKHHLFKEQSDCFMYV